MATPRGLLLTLSEKELYRKEKVDQKSEKKKVKKKWAQKSTISVEEKAARGAQDASASQCVGTEGIAGGQQLQCWVLCSPSASAGNISS